MKGEKGLRGRTDTDTRRLPLPVPVIHIITQFHSSGRRGSPSLYRHRADYSLLSPLMGISAMDMDMEQCFKFGGNSRIIIIIHY